MVLLALEGQEAVDRPDHPGIGAAHAHRAAARERFDGVRDPPALGTHHVRARHRARVHQAGEMEISGGLIGRPLEVLRGPITGLPIPASSEIAIEGEAHALAERIGMEGLLAKVRALGVAATGGGLPDGLSPREAQILQLVARGLSNREIGTELSISEHTAANHIRSILRKSGCANRTEAATYAHTHGLVAT